MRPDPSYRSGEPPLPRLKLRQVRAYRIAGVVLVVGVSVCGWWLVAPVLFRLIDFIVSRVVG